MDEKRGIRGAAPGARKGHKEKVEWMEPPTDFAAGNAWDKWDRSRAAEGSGKVPAEVSATKQGFSFLSSRGKLFNEIRTQITAAIGLA